MASGNKTKAEIQDERQIRLLVKALRSKGFEVRREKLARGDAFRVKSGTCNFSGKDLIFVDSRLQTQQQVSVLIDYMVDLQIVLDDEELAVFSPSTRSLLVGRLPEAVVG